MLRSVTLRLATATRAAPVVLSNLVSALFYRRMIWGFATRGKAGGAAMLALLRHFGQRVGLK